MLQPVLISILISACIITMAFIAVIYSVYRMKYFRQKLSSSELQISEETKKQQDLLTQITDLKQEIAQNELIDLLTGLPTRKVFEDRLVVALNQSMRYQLTFGVLSLDLDRFQMINDVLGHDTGDLLLKEIAERLRVCIRQVDTICRFVGDEFIFLLPQLSKGETAAYVAQRLLDAVAQPVYIRGEVLYVTASIGIAVYPADGNDVKTLLQCVDSALHQAKLRGRNIYQFYREEMHTLSRRELLLSSDLHSDLIYRDLSIYYQPQINIETKQVVCMEALLQWQHPDFGLVKEDELLHLTENSGKIVAVGTWLLRNVCQDFMKWRAPGFAPEHVSMAVSLKQIENSHFIHKVSTLLQEINMDAACLVLEIAETSLTVKVDLIERMLHMLAHRGIKISISHFGTGHFPLQHLRRLPVDIIKIDRLLVQDITSNEESKAIVKMIIALTQNLQITVVADGVENAEQKQLLNELGCNIMQGALFGRPSLPQEFTGDRMQSIREKV